MDPEISHWLHGDCIAGLSSDNLLSSTQLESVLAHLSGWQLVEAEMVKSFAFASYTETMAFANAVAWIALRQDHHPEMVVSYNRCTVRFTTHSAGGITLNDTRCAAQVQSWCGDESDRR
jgi:4a-hydroxytetrahydrobiopterin dehydratase